jgi:O-antigen/teichoic acid export membrane protein
MLNKLSNTAVFGLLQAFERIISFLFLPLLTKVVQPKDYAIWTQSVITAGVMTPILLLGFQTATIKYLPMWESDPARKYSLLRFMFTGVLVMIGCVTGLLIGFDEQAAYLIFGQSDHLGYIPVLVGLVVSEVFFEFLTGILRANGLIRRIALYMLLKGVWRIGVFIAAFYGFALEFNQAYVCFVVIQILLIGLMYLRDFPCHSLLVTRLSEGRRQWSEVMAFSLPLVPLALLLSLNNFSNRYFLANLKGLDEVAIYSAAYSLAATASFFYSVLGFTLFPALSRCWADGSLEQCGKIVNRTVMTYLFFLVPFIAGLTIVGPAMMSALTTKAYTASPCLLMILGCSIGIFGLYQIAFYVTLLRHGSLHGLLWTAVAASVNVILNAVFIPAYGIIGAALAGCLSNAILAISTVRLSRHVVPWSFSWSWGKRILIHTLCMVAFLVITAIWPGYNELTSLLAVICLATILYVTLDYLDYKNSILIGPLKSS